MRAVATVPTRTDAAACPSVTQPGHPLDDSGTHRRPLGGLGVEKIVPRAPGGRSHEHMVARERFAGGLSPAAGFASMERSVRRFSADGAEATRADRAAADRPAGSRPAPPTGFHAEYSV